MSAVGDTWPQFVLVGVLVVVNAAFAGTELALVSLREGQLQRLEERSSTGVVLARLARQPNQFLATIQIGITLAGFLASAAAAVSLAQPLEEPLSFLGGAAEAVSVIIVTLVLAYFTLVFGELAPKRIAMQRAEKWGMVMARPLDFLSTLTKPVVWLLSRSTDLAVRLLGGDPNIQREVVTEEELRDMVAIHETFSDEQRLIIDGAFEIAERRLDEVMVPRNDVAVVDAAATCAEALAFLLETGHSPRIHLLTDSEIFGWQRPRPRQRHRPVAEAPEAAYADLNPGDWVVHVDHGVGKFVGLVRRTIENAEREYLCIEYAEGDQLFVPVHQADRLTSYVGSSSREPNPTRLGGTQWMNTKSKPCAPQGTARTHNSSLPILPLA